MPKKSSDIAPRGKTRQVSRILSADTCKQQRSARRDTRADNFRFQASEEDIRRWREQRDSNGKTNGGGHVHAS